MTVTPAAPPAAPSGTPEVLALADGVELIGEYEGSGFREPPLLARRGDGQMVKLTPLLHDVAAACDGRRDAEQVAAVVSEQSGRGVSAGNVRQLAEEQLRPLGVLAQADGTTPELPKRRALLALRHRRPILRERAVNVIAAGFAWLHAQPVKALLLLALALFDAWLFGVHGIAGGIRTVLYEPAWLLALLCSIVAATAFHEIGHASACRFSGARPGEMGVGVYLIWPAFYCDVTEAYRLDRRGRLRTDLGGVYFNGLFALMAGAAYFATGAEALLFAAFIQHLIVLQQLMPLLRFDGYYVLSDLTGVPDILSRVKPIFRSLVRGRRKEPRVAELKSWVRVAVTAYLIVLVPLLTFFIGSIVLSAPRTFATAYDSFGLQLDRLRASHGTAELGVGAFRIAALVMPLAAMSLSLSRTVRMAVKGIAAWSRGSVLRRGLAVASVGLVAGATAFMWWPNGDYQPIRPGEKGTIGEAISSVPAIASGRPSFTPEREQRYGQEQTVREQAATAGSRHGADGEGEGEREGEGSGYGESPGPDGREPTPFGDEGVGEDEGTDSTGGDPSEDFDAGDTSTGTSEDPAGTATPAPSGTAPAPSGTTAPAPEATATPSPTATATATPTATPAPTTTGAAPSPESTTLASPTPSPIQELQAPTAEPTPLPTP